jgi:aryl-alcohol dehydrogenase-like predicted oxidoreductase
MEKRRMGNSELEVSVVGFGCWGTSGGEFWTGGNDKDSIEAIQTAFEQSVNFFDVAPVYGFGHAEEVLGKAMQGKRNEIIIGSKCGLVWDDSHRISNNLSRESILKEIDDSLRRLNTDYIDLYQLHWPDYNTPIQETMETLNDIKKAGKIRYIGLSNYPVKLAEEALQYSEVASQQCLYNMFDRNEDLYHGIPLYYHTEDEILTFCKKHNIGFIPYSPLAQGLLTGKFNLDKNFDSNDVRVNNPNLNGAKLAESIGKVKELQEISKRIEKPLNQIAINWLISNPVITTVICGAKTAEQATKNSLSGSWKLDDETLKEINSVLYGGTEG